MARRAQERAEGVQGEIISHDSRERVAGRAGCRLAAGAHIVSSRAMRRHSDAAMGSPGCNFNGRLPEVAERFGYFMVVGWFLVAGGVLLLHALTGLVFP